MRIDHGGYRIPGEAVGSHATARFTTGRTLPNETGSTWVFGSAPNRWSRTEELRLRRELNLDLESDDGLPTVATHQARRAPPSRADSITRLLVTTSDLNQPRLFSGAR